MMSYPFNQGDVGRLCARYRAWKQERDVLAVKESSSHWPAPGEWAGNEDTAVELLQAVAVLLGWER